MHESKKKYTEVEIRLGIKSIEVLQAKLAECPREWIYWYVLCDELYTRKNYLEMVQAAQKCYELRPKDPRSTSAWPWPTNF
jgi:hypothetical protein